MAQMMILMALAGATGTLARYGMAELVSHLLGKGFPWSTLSINVLGSLLYGLVSTLGYERKLISDQMLPVLLVGFMGGFTTFSTFAFENSQLLSSPRWHLAIANIVAQNGVGIVAVFVGSAMARWW